MYNSTEERFEKAMRLVNDINISAEKKSDYALKNFYQLEVAFEGFKDLHLGRDASVTQAIDFYNYISNDYKYHDYTMAELREIMIAFKTVLKDFATIILQGGDYSEEIDFRDYVK